MTQQEAEEMSVMELKAAVYDQLASLQAIQSNIKVLNIILEKKIKEEKNNVKQ